MTRLSRSPIILGAAFAAMVGLIGACSQRSEQPAAQAGLKPSGVAAVPDQRLERSFREDRNGWIFVHLEGRPGEIGFQHGWHLAPEIDDLLKTMAFYFKPVTKRDWAFYRQTAERIFWPKLDAESREEIEGIAAGVRARLPETTYDRFDITALNGWIELTDYYVPLLDEKTKPGAADSKAPPHCSAFVATGAWTKDGRIVIAHNNWTGYIIGERWNVILDIVPAAGFRILMDALPGTIHSGDDFAVNSAGLVYTETTISQFRGFKEDAVPEFARARKAAQYAATIDDFVRIMGADNNGGYANDWLVGDLRANEIARFELGLKHSRLWRTKDGYYIGSNFPLDEKLIAEETTFDPRNARQSVLVRKARWEKLMAENKGSIDVDKAMAFMGDHVDASTGMPADNADTLCGHADGDAAGIPEFSWGPWYPGGAVQGKAATAELAGQMKFWARMGHPCGRDFLAAPYLQKHPDWKWLSPYLHDMKGNPWTLFESRR